MRSRHRHFDAITGLLDARRIVLGYGYGCLVAWGDAGNNGDAFTAYGSKSSIWTFTGAEEIRSFNNKCLQPQTVGNHGESIVLMSCTGALNQKWSNAAGTTAAPTPIASLTLSAHRTALRPVRNFRAIRW